MKIETFRLERIQSLYENLVEINLTESGIHPYSLRELLDAEEVDELLDVRQTYGQTNGSVALRETIAALYPGAARDNILVTSGSAEANFVAMWNLLQPGDELVLVLPNYMQIWGLARSFGVEVRPVHLRENLSWGLDLDELRSAVSPRTRMIAFCNPNNPTGSVLSDSTMAGVVELAASVDAWVYCDEIYRGADLTSRPTPTFWGLHDKVMVTGGVSKAYALPGLRIGWLAGPAAEIEQCWARRDYTTIATSPISQYVATLALTAPRREKILQRNVRILQANLEVLQAWVDRHGGRLRCIPPRAGGMSFMSYELEIGSTEFVTRLRKDKDVLVIAGDDFGMDHHLRIGIGGEQEMLVAGLDRVDELIRELA